MTELEITVLNLINKITDSKYISSLKVLVDEDSYFLKLILNQKESPMCIYYQGNESGFLKYLEKDLSARQIERTGYYKMIRTEEEKDNIITIN